MNLDEFTTLEQLAAALKSLDMVTAVPWTDYRLDSTVIGWTTYTTKLLFHKKIGKLVFVEFEFGGESNSPTTSFTLEFTSIAGIATQVMIWVADDGTWATCRIYLGPSSNTLICYLGIAGGWTNSGTKAVVGQFWYEAAL